MILELVTAEPLLTQARAIFREYQESLGIDLSFQGFADELAALPGKYAPPRGRLYLAFVEGAPAGCVALRSLTDGRCEMKRLYVVPAFRGRNIGRLLADRVIADARQIGYRQMLLDSLPAMSAAQQLYRSLRFREVPPYGGRAIAGTVFMGLDL